MKDKVFYQELLDSIKEIPVIDTHEHIESEDTRIKRNVDMFNIYMMHYVSSDLISSGMPDDDMIFLKSESNDIEKKWRIFKPYWEKSKNTVYCKSLILSTNDIYGINDINDNTYKAVNEEMIKKNKKGLYEYVLKTICNIETGILDSDFKCDKHFFVSAANFDSDFIRFNSRQKICNIEKQFNVSINSLSDWVNVFKKYIQDSKRIYNIPCIKSALAYERILKYNRTDYSLAENIFNRILSSIGGWEVFTPVNTDTKPLEDYLMHVLVQTASELDIPLQFHTGLLEGNGNNITNSNPTHLINLFMEYPKARFDIFHAGYPYGGELCTIAKNFRNVYVDLCWSHIISREYTVKFIEEMIDTVPASKIFGFGGDYLFIEGVCGHLRIAKENIALALANKVEKGYLTKKEGFEIAKRMLYDNPKEFFGL